LQVGCRLPTGTDDERQRPDSARQQPKATTRKGLRHSWPKCAETWATRVSSRGAAVVAHAVEGSLPSTRWPTSLTTRGPAAGPRRVPRAAAAGRSALAASRRFVPSASGTFAAAAHGFAARRGLVVAFTALTSRRPPVLEQIATEVLAVAALPMVSG